MTLKQQQHERSDAKQKMAWYNTYADWMEA